VLERWKSSLASRRPFDMILPLRGADGIFRPFLTRVMPLQDEQGRVQQWFGTNTDISEQKRAEEALRELNATLESKVAQRTAELQHRARQLQKLTLELSQAEERERRRIAVLLHEDLQQQIAGAKFHLNLVRRRSRDEALRAHVDTVDEMLTAAVEQSRNLSRDLSPAVVRMKDLAEVLQWLVNRIHEQQGLNVQVRSSGDMTLHSEALAMFLFRTAQELLLNVVKHARVREASIRVRRIGRYVCLSVSDQGCGFDPQELKETPGFGLFSIRERTELLGGRMRVRSAKGQGSRFRIMVPDSEAGEKVGSEEREKVRGPLSTSDLLPVSPSLPPGVRRLRVLLVDDHDIVREGLAALLQEASDIEVVGEAPDGREAINLAMDVRPDVVVMDVSMPVMSGDQATRQIKTYLPTARVIALSMYDEADKKERMYRAGAESYVLKTASADELLAAIRGKESDSSRNPV
jgi:signal transduction histidine kinase/ActR/RegA family two-component response regulator